MAISREYPKKIAKFSRYFVPDLTPMDRKELRNLRPEVVFVAESPHVSEVTPESEVERRPLCGSAGKKWWALLGELLGDDQGEDVALTRMLHLCEEYRIALLNVLQYPLDKGIRKKIPGADPVANLGFCKNPGNQSYKKLKNTDSVTQAIQALRDRLMDPRLLHARIHCLGNDAEWFVKQALGKEEYQVRVGEKLPHPSAWWRRGGHFGRVARKQLKSVITAHGLSRGC